MTKFDNETYDNKIKILKIKKLEAEIQILHYESILRGMRVDKEKENEGKD